MELFWTGRGRVGGTPDPGAVKLMAFHGKLEGEIVLRSRDCVMMGMGAALEHLAGNQPEPEDARPLSRAMLTRAFLMLEVAKEHHVWPDDAMLVLHSQDEEGNQFRRHFDQEQGWV